MRRASALRLAPAGAALLLGASFFALQRWLEQGRLTDIPVYARYASLMRAGALPYRDFPLEYPPAALPAFLLPSYLPWSYATSFAVVMGVCGAGCIAAAAAALHALDATPLRATAAVLVVGVSPLALGSLFDSRFDLWPALLAVAALAAALHERPVAAGALAGLAFSAKLWPLALAPLLLVHLWRRRGAVAAAAGAAGFAAAAAVCFAPFAAIASGAVWHSLVSQLDRPLQVESLGAAVLYAGEHLGGLSLTTVTTHGSQALAGSLPDAVAAASSALEALCVVAIWGAFASRRRPTAEALVAACAAATAALVAFGKVFSPQFLIWLVPLVPLVRGRRGLAGSLLLLAALGVTQAWFPDHYWTLALGHSGPYWWYLLARDLAVVALAVVLAWPEKP